MLEHATRARADAWSCSRTQGRRTRRQALPLCRHAPLSPWAADAPAALPPAGCMHRMLCGCCSCSWVSLGRGANAQPTLASDRAGNSGSSARHGRDRLFHNHSWRAAVRCHRLLGRAAVESGRLGHADGGHRRGGRRRRACMWLTLRRVMAGETIRLFTYSRADFADGERAPGMLWRWRHASESRAFIIGTGTGRSCRDLMLALGAACGRVLVIASVDMPEAMRPHAHIHLSPRRRGAGGARSAITPRACRSRTPCATSSPITGRHRTRSYQRRWAAGRHHTCVLRQEETTDGPQQALGRHLGHLAGAE